MIGWFDDLTAANAAMASQYGRGGWSALSSDDQTALMIDSYNRIRYSWLFTIPESPDGDLLERLQLAQAETAWYLKLHKNDEDSRLGLQAQGVTQAGIVGETYATQRDIPLPNIVHALLGSIKKPRYSILGTQMIRDDEAE